MSNTISYAACPCCNQKLQNPQYVGLHQRDFYKCSFCKLISVNQRFLPDNFKEKVRYQHHNNLSSDLNYVAWLARIINPMITYITADMKGLDYGCGPNPVLSELLTELSFTCCNFDPFFFSKLEIKKYDYIFCTEVVEHFHAVREEWERMLSHLKPNGHLAVMTQTWSDETDFNTWYYVRDITHTSFYHLDTMTFLADDFKLKLLYSDGKSVFIFRKR